MALKQFSKIFIFKNTPETRAAFGVYGTVDTLFSPNGTSVSPATDIKFDGSYPNANLTNFDDTFFQNNLLHAMGVNEIGTGNGADGWNLEPVSSGKGYIYDGYLNAFIVDNYDGSVEEVGDLPPFASSNGQTYVVATTNTPYTSDGTAWTADTQIPFTFTNPSTPLEEGDILFYGDDPNNLRIAGKITSVYNSGSPEWIDGKRYKLSIDNDPDNVNLNNYQDIYYYRGDWNGRNISVDVSEGFYILIGVETINGQRVVYPYLNTGSNATTTSSNQLIEPGTGNNAYADLIRVKRISEKYKYEQDRLSDNSETQEIIPCTIRRTNSIKSTVFTFNKISSMVAFPTTSDFPYWVSYFVNPYGESEDTLLKSSVYAIEINEMLPFFTINYVSNDSSNYQFFLNQKV
jgi:hypothetical protein